MQPVVEVQVRAAEDALMETTPIRMSKGGFKAFLDALSKPANAAPEMIEVLRRKAPWESENEARKGGDFRCA
jgi:uncharacterized protein (DUF1778 family)